ncbi:MAG TPA: tetratricopeptide repeat protein [Rhizomicrobium sp.]|nr:tetratricopeptide repeat protein [Rhizomicrobium sp.]
MAAGESAFGAAAALHRSGRLREAEAAYMDVLRQSGDHFGAAHGLGMIFLQTGRPELAARSLGLALRIEADNAAAHHDYGLALQALAQHAQALECFERSLAIAPDNAGAHFNRGRALAALGRAGEALAAVDAAIARAPADAMFLYERANILLRLGRAAEAVEGYGAAIALRPDYFEAFLNRANALRELDRLADALCDYERAASLRPNEPLAAYNRALALQDAGRFDEAMAGYRRAVALAPAFGEARKARGTLKLLLGRYREGFEDFEARLTSSDAALDPALRRLRYWDGRDPAGKTIAVYGDGAFGDLIQFSRYLPLLAARGAKVLLMVPRRFHRVLSPEALCASLAGDAGDPAGADFRCELMSLPHVFGTAPGGIPPAVDVIRRDGARTARWRAHLGPDGFKVGICWQGNPARNIDRGRSIPLAQFAPLARIDGVRLISLQKAHGLEQLGALPGGMKVETLGDAFDAGDDAFVDTAAVVDCLDLVVTSDTALAHLCATMGRPAWVALRRVPEWRWGVDRADSPWYPSVRLFRQREEGGWPDVFADIARAIGDLRRGV